jgi:hypothetical protein
MGEIADEHADAMYDRDDDEEDAYATPGSPGEVKCKYCGAFPLTWLHTGVRWRLTDERGRFHECVTFSKDDFE